MKWRLILPVVALFGIIGLMPQAAWSHHCHHHHRWMMMNNGYGAYGGNPYGYGGMSQYARMFGGGYGNYGNYGAPYGGMYGSPYGDGYGGGGMMNTFGRILRGF